MKCNLPTFVIVFIFQVNLG